MNAIVRRFALVALLLALPAANASAGIGYATNSQFMFEAEYAYSDTMGFRLQAAYAPSYLTESNEGYWCDPYYGCYTYPNPQYLDQWEFSLGIVKRFGTLYR